MWSDFALPEYDYQEKTANQMLKNKEQKTFAGALKCLFKIKKG